MLTSKYRKFFNFWLLVAIICGLISSNPTKYQTLAAPSANENPVNNSSATANNDYSHNATATTTSPAQSPSPITIPMPTTTAATAAVSLSEVTTLPNNNNTVLKKSHSKLESESVSVSATNPNAIVDNTSPITTMQTDELMEATTAVAIDNAINDDHGSMTLTTASNNYSSSNSFSIISNTSSDIYTTLSPSNTTTSSHHSLSHATTSAVDSSRIPDMNTATDIAAATAIVTRTDPVSSVIDELQTSTATTTTTTAVIDTADLNAVKTSDDLHGDNGELVAL